MARRDTLKLRPPPGSDGQRQLVERGGHPPVHRLLSGQLVVSASKVLDEPMVGDDHPSLQAVSWEADQAAQVLPDPGVVVLPVVAVHGAQVPWGKVVVEGVPVAAARRLPSMLRALPPLLGPERITAVADQARVRFHAAA
jgi:hypothetical protein